jgi:hypothetical protein
MADVLLVVLALILGAVITLWLARRYFSIRIVELQNDNERLFDGNRSLIILLMQISNAKD